MNNNNLTMGYFCVNHGKVAKALTSILVKLQQRIGNVFSFLLNSSLKKLIIYRRHLFLLDKLIFYLRSVSKLTRMV